MSSSQTDPELLCQGPLRDSWIAFDEPQRPQFGFIAQIVRSPTHGAAAAPKLPHGLTRKGGRIRGKSSMSPLGTIPFNNELIPSIGIRASKIR